LRLFFVGGCADDGDDDVISVDDDITTAALREDDEVVVEVRGRWQPTAKSMGHPRAPSVSSRDHCSTNEACANHFNRLRTTRFSINMYN
jgi:hypothetical protein